MSKRSKAQKDTRAQLAKRSRSITLRAIKAERARRSFEAYVRLIRPGYKLEFFHKRLVDEIQAWADAPDPSILVFELPPGHGKSEYAKLAVTWLVVRSPDLKIAYLSYAQSMASAQMGDIQKTLEDEDHVYYFGHCINPRRVVTDERRGKKRTQDHFEPLGGRGFVKAVGVSGGLTGFRLNVAIGDDLIENDEAAQSATKRNKVWSWLTKVVMTRKRPGDTLRQLFIGTRWHIDDAIGRLKASNAFKVRCVRYQGLRHDMSDPDDPREYGQALWPAAADEAFQANFIALDPEGHACLFQQDPTPPGGKLFDLERFGRWIELPKRGYQIYQSWDCRGGGKEHKGSWLVAQVWLRITHPFEQHYLIHQVRERADMPRTLALFGEICERFPGSIALIEGKADGKSLLSLGVPAAKAAGVKMIEIQPPADKATRARAVQPTINAGAVFIPAQAAWLYELITELRDFPGSATDDQVDALTQYLSRASHIKRPAIAKVMI